ncbi:MAG: flagellar hook-associated protein FlgK [Brevinematales bacterium]
MLSTFHGIETGKKGLMSNNMGIQTTGHNLSNVETEGYSRQKVNLSTTIPLYEPSANRVEVPGQIGTGVQVEDIQRVRDQAIDDRINYEKGGLGYWETKQKFLHQLETIFNEPDKPNLRTVLDDFWESWQKLAADPTEQASRLELIQRAELLAKTMNHTYNSVYDLRQNVNLLIEQKIAEINHIAREIATLNIQIVKSEAMGDKPNDLYDKRDLLADRLSKIVDIRIERNNKHELIVYIGTENLVQGGKVHEVRGVGEPENDGLTAVLWDDGRQVKLGAGELAGLMDVRDNDLRKALQNLNSLAVNITDTTNEVHRDGFGLNLTTNNNFFKEIPLSPVANGDYDFNNDGIFDGVAIFRVSGTERLDEHTVIGSSGFLNFGPSRFNGQDVLIQYQATDKVKDVIERINQSDAGVVAYLNHKGQLSLKAKIPEDRRFPQFVIRHIEDSGNFLVGVAGILSESGANGAFDYRTPGNITKFNVPAENVALTFQKNQGAWFGLDEKILANPDSIAAAAGIDTNGDGDPDRINGLGDNRNALQIAELRHRKIMIEERSSASDFIKAMIGDFGTRSEAAIVNMDKNKAVVDSLENLRKQISGVNVDEELSKMIMYQHGYNASARLVSVIDRMIETLIRMGA